MEIKPIKRPWQKEGQRKGRIDPIYQTTAWKRTVDRIWVRDKSTCQMCKEKGIVHVLERGTKDLSRQGTVDHKVQRLEGGSDGDDNLWLIGSNHHNSKRAHELNQMKKKP